MADVARDDDPTTWFPVAKAPAAKAAPAANDDDPTTWFPVAKAGAKPAPPAATKPQPEGGIVRNIGAGAMEGGAGGINFLSDPFGSVGQMALIAGGTAYDALAPYVGLPRMTEDTRRTLYGQDRISTSVPQIGTRIANALAENLPEGSRPENVPANTPVERVARAGTTGAIAGTMLPGNALLATTAGAAGAIAGEEGARLAPEWAQPGVQLLGNALGAGTFIGAAPLLRAGPGRLSEGVLNWAETGRWRGGEPGGPGGGGPPAPPEPNLVQGMPPVPPEVAARIGQRPAAPSEPIPTPAQPVGGAAGADVTTQPIPAKTRVERIRDLQKAVEQSPEERAGPRLVDNHPYVPDIPPRLLAGRDFSTSVNALDEKVAVAKDPLFRDAVDANKRVRNEGMIEYLRNDAGDATALDIAHTERAKVSPSELRVFEGETAVDASGLLGTIDRLLAGPEGKQKAVRTTLEQVRESLLDGDGNLETLPSRIYGARKNLTDLLQRGVKGTGDLADDVRAARHHLNALIPAFDETITSGAAKFTDYLRSWHEASKPIDRMEFLQQYFSGPKKITGDDGYLKPAKVQKMLDDILQAHKRPGNNPATVLTDEQINRIEAVRNELAAQQMQDRLAAVRGSDSFQQFMHRFGDSGPLAGAVRNVAEIGANVLSAGVYPWLVKPVLEQNRLNKAGRKTEARKNQLLQPPSGPEAP